jgi:uncharacterized protein (DUF2384 family)
MPTIIRVLEPVERLHDEFGFTYGELARAATANEATLHRWRRGEGGEPTAVYQARLAALGAFLDELGRTFRRARDAKDWIAKPLPALKGRSPRQLILEGHVDRVTGLLYAINAGVAN